VCQKPNEKYKNEYMQGTIKAAKESFNNFLTKKYSTKQVNKE